MEVESEPVSPEMKQRGPLGLAAALPRSLMFLIVDVGPSSSSHLLQHDVLHQLDQPV